METKQPKTTCGVDLDLIRQENNRLTDKQPAAFLDNFVPMPEGEGTVVIRLLPPSPTSEVRLPFVATRTHKLGSKNHHCPMTLVGNKWVGNCPVCNYYKQLWAQSDVSDEETAKEFQSKARAIKPVERYYWNAIVRKMTTQVGTEVTNAGPRIFSCGKQLQAKIIRAMCGAPEFDEPELGDVTDLLKGRDLKVIKRMVKSGADSYPSYNESRFLQESKAGDKDELVKFVANLHDLKALRLLKSFDELNRELEAHRNPTPVL